MENNNKLNKGLIVYECCYVIACVLCKYIFEFNSFNENILMMALSIISAVIILIEIIIRKRAKQYAYMTHLFVFAVFTILLIKWSFDGGF